MGRTLLPQEPEADPDRAPRGVPLWFITFSDLMGLLVGFFVLLYAFSNLEANRFRAIAGSVREAFGGQTSEAGGLPSPAAPAVPAPDAREAGAGLPASLAERASAGLTELGLGLTAEVEPAAGSVRLRFPDHLFFDAGSVVLARRAAPLLEEIAELGAGGAIIVEAHTDDRAVRGAEQSARAFTAARAAALADALVAHGVPPEQVDARAFGSARPLAPNHTVDNRQRNRRIEIVIAPLP